jgi:hypothetical protein
MLLFQPLFKIKLLFSPLLLQIETRVRNLQGWAYCPQRRSIFLQDTADLSSKLRHGAWRKIKEQTKGKHRAAPKSSHQGLAVQGLMHTKFLQIAAKLTKSGQCMKLHTRIKW